MKTRHKHVHRTGGQTLLIVVFLFLVAVMFMLLGVSVSVIGDVQTVDQLEKSRAALALTESVVEDTIYRLNEGYTISAIETLTLNNSTATALITDVNGDGTEYDISASTTVDTAVRKSDANVVIGEGTSFSFGIQAAEGGITLKNSSSVQGNAFSNGTISGSANTIGGDVISAGSSGLVSNIHATGSVWSNDIQNSTVDVDCHYQTISGTTCSGSTFPGSSDQATSSLPITDDEIDTWKSEAEAGGTITCNGGTVHNITSDTTIGPKKIPCNLAIRNSTTDVTLTGHLWIEGNIDIRDGASLDMDSSLGSDSVVVVADKSSDSDNKGRIVVRNSATFTNSGTEGSYILLISGNTSAENSGTKNGIEFHNTASGDVLAYANHGEVLIRNSADIRQISAYEITAENSAVITYELGLAHVLFTGGPSGGFVLNSWGEVY